jgi:hypothetical protein
MEGKEAILIKRRGFGRVLQVTGLVENVPFCLQQGSPA